MFGIPAGSVEQVDGKGEKNPLFLLEHFLVKSILVQNLVETGPTSLLEGNIVRKEDGADLVVHLGGEDIVIELSQVLVFGDGV